MKSNIQDKKVGSAMVVGGGIGGIQTALDLADSGFKVYLLENAPAIGGTMSQLDKTFPTGDCSMCMISPKLVECGRHLNIKLITYADVEGVSGSAGNFKVRVKKRARYVDESKCNGCGDCEQACPVDIENNFDEGLADRKAIYRLYPQAFPNVYTITKRGTSPCRLTCPAGINAQGYVALIAQGKFDKALELILETTPFPGVLGRVCTHPCEGQCERGKVDEPIAICALKRFAADYGRAKPNQLPIPNSEFRIPNSNKVAVIGGGPAGLTAAYHLTKMGYPVTVFERFSVAGGMLKLGIPNFRLPKNIVDYEIEAIRKSGVEIRTNTIIGRDISFEELRKEYKSIFVAIGAIESGRLRIEGENLKGVLNALDFLAAVNLEQKVEIGRRVVVVGGGNTALDSARTSLRLGAETVRIIYRRSEEEMPALPREIAEALEEGIRIDYLVAPKRILEQTDSRNNSRNSSGQAGRSLSPDVHRGAAASQVIGLECTHMQLGEMDKSGRRKSLPIAGSEFNIDADTVILAINRYADLSFLPKEIAVAPDGNLVADSETLATNLPGIFAGGDVVSGPDILVKAIAAGKEAAISIDRYLKGLDPKEGRPKRLLFTKDEELIRKERVERRKRQIMPVRALKERIRSFREIELGFDEVTAREEARRCLSCGGCSECLECVKVCKPQAIDHRMPEQTLELDVGAIVLSTGLSKFDARLKGEYGFGRYRNVVTSIQFERILSASGPFRGEIKRPADGKHPTKIAFIQCVGSRDTGIGHGYCSSVCCMYATKQAIVAKEHNKDIQPTIFFIDLRTFGKGFERYVQRAKDKYGINYKRCMLSGVKETAQTKNLMVNYVDSEGAIQEEEFDMVVLAVGLEPSASAIELSKRLGLQLNHYNFCQTNTFSPNRTNLPGVFVAGVFQSPKDIPETVMQGSSAAGSVAELINEARGSETQQKTYPEEFEVKDNEPRIGVFICHCGINIAATVDVKNVVEYVSKFPNVVWSEDVLYACSQDCQENIKKKIKELNLNRVVVASCTPRTHEPLFQETIREVGMNRHLFEMANIREQCSWVHSKSPSLATQKAKVLVAMAIAKSRLLEPFQPTHTAVTPKALIIGGGLAGMTAALSLANQGFGVALVEKGELGGNLRYLYYTLSGENIQPILKGLITQIENHPLVQVYKNSEVKEVQGYVGNFITTLTTDISPARQEEKIEHGVIIVATGGEEYKPTEYLYGSDDRILTQRELEEMIATKTLGLKPNTSVVMIQCVGSREEKHLYCSRVCCSTAIKNALKIKELEPTVNIYILYRDILTYAFQEDYYRKARESGITFIRFEPESRPEVKREQDGKLIVTVSDILLREKIMLKPDRIVLSTAILSASGNKKISEALKVPLDEDGFFLEAHVKLRPVDFANEGIFLCGLAHSPKSIDETISQAMAVVGRVGRILSRDYLEVEGVSAVIDPDKCATCLTCLRVCPYDAPYVNEEGKAEIKTVKCQGCGICAGECPAKAIQVQQFRDEQIIAMIDNFLAT